MQPDSNARLNGERYDLGPHANSLHTHAAPLPDRILILATLDTKFDEARFVAEAVQACAGQPWLVDIGTAGRPPQAGQTTRQDVARAAGLTDDAGLAAMTKLDAMRTVVAGATRLVHAMLERDEVGAVLGIGGGQGTWMATAIMRALPLGLPKLMVSTAASRDIGPFVGHSDILMLPSVTDIAGLHSLLTPILANAAAAACGMAASRRAAVPSTRPRVAMSMFGITTGGGTHARSDLEAAGYEVVVFHANGSGGAALEELTARALFVSVLDWTITELADELVGGIRTAGPERLEAAAAAGVPQVVIPGGLDAVNFGPESSVPRRFRGRKLYAHTPETTLMRTSAAENHQLGEYVAAKLNRARGPVRVLIPSAGFSALDAPGGPFEDQAANAAFTASLAAHLRQDIVLDRRPEHINDARFARAAADALVALSPAPQHTAGRMQ